MVIIKSENQLKMKKVVRILGLCALVALATVSCKKDDNNVPQGGKSFRATINQPTDGAKTHIGDGNYLMWNSGDEIKVYTADGTSAVFTTTDADVYEDAVFTGDIKEADKYVAFYPADNASGAQEGNVILTLPDQQTYEANNFANDAYPMAAYWEGTAGDDVDFQFHSPCAVVCLPLKGNANVTSIDLSGKALTDVLAGTLKVDINNFDPANPSAGGYTPVSAKWTVSLSCGNGIQLNPTNATNFYFVVAAPQTIFKKGLKFVVNYEGGNETLETTQDNSLSAETILTMPIKEVNKPTPPIGDFTISYGKRITFAPGNLWYDASNTGKEWRMEDDQLDFHGGADSDALGLFSWSNQNNNYGIGHANGDEFKDWGNLSICKPGSRTEQYAPGEWRTLTAFEQLYLLEYRNRASDLRNVKNINGTNYLVLMPDSWTGSWSSNWETLKAQGGFAMAMVGGYVPFNPENPQDYYGPYAENEELAWWSSDLNNDDPNHGQSKLLYYFLNNSFYVYDDDANGSQYHMFSVRLVKDVE